jgi:hypothetical protein
LLLIKPVLIGHLSIKTTEIYANWVRKEALERWVKMVNQVGSGVTKKTPLLTRVF